MDAEKIATMILLANQLAQAGLTTAMMIQENRAAFSVAEEAEARKALEALQASNDKLCEVVDGMLAAAAAK